MTGEHTWLLRRSGEVVAELAVTGGDFPWLNATVRPGPGFADLRPLFDNELRQLDYLDEDYAAWEAAYDQIRQAVS